MSRRVDDHHPAWCGCGKLVREKGGRHVWRVRAVHFGNVLVTSVDNGWLGEFELGDLEPDGRAYLLQQEVTS
jgi:hypothetical protein